MWYVISAVTARNKEKSAFELCRDESWQRKVVMYLGTDGCCTARQSWHNGKYVQMTWEVPAITTGKPPGGAL